MTEQLALKYRPMTFGDVAGQKPSVAVLYRMCQRRDVPGGMLFAGEHGCGKTTMARMVAKALNCESGHQAAGVWPCGTCASCKAITGGTSLDVEELDAASNGTVDQIREVRDRAYYGALPGRFRVFVVDEAHGLSGAAFEALLILLESPPPGVLLILCTTLPGKIPATIQSRLSPFRFDPIPVAVIRDRLARICQAEGIAAEPDLLTAIAEAGNGSMRDAVMRLDQVSRVGISTLALWRELTGESDYAPGLLIAAADGNYAALYEGAAAALARTGDPAQVVRDLVRTMADMLVLTCNGEIPALGEALAVRRDLAMRFGARRIHAAMAVLWELQTRVKVDDRETALTLALAMVAKRLMPPPAPIAAEAPDRVASVREMEDIMRSA
jgi:DNA polymerase-3 subunit gamma/tau